MHANDTRYFIFCNIKLFTQNAIVNANGHDISIFPLGNINMILVVDGVDTTYDHGVDMIHDPRSTFLIVIDDCVFCIVPHSCSNGIKVSSSMPLVVFM